MSYRLTIWSRAGEVLSSTGNRDAHDAHASFFRPGVRGRHGLISHASEGMPNYPGSQAFAFDPLMITRLAAGIRDGLVEAPSRRLPPAARTVVLPCRVRDRDLIRGDGGTPLLPPKVVMRLRDVELQRLTRNGVLRTALCQLGVRTGSDLAGVGVSEVLALLGGDRDLLEAFRRRARTRRVDPREGAAVGPPATVAASDAARGLGAGEPRRIEVCASVGAARMPRRAATGTGADSVGAGIFGTPLLGRIRRSLEDLDVIDGAMLSRRLALGGYPASLAGLGRHFGIGETELAESLAGSLTKLDDGDGWPSLLGGLAPEILPVSASEMDLLPWYRGLNPRMLASILRFGAGVPANLIETSSGPVVGPAGQAAWTDMVRNARRLVLATNFNASPSRFRSDLRAAIPSGREGYERFLLPEIGWPRKPHVDWLIAMRAKVSPKAEMVQVAGSRWSKSMASVMPAYHPWDASAERMRDGPRGDAPRSTDDTVGNRRRWVAEDPEVARVARACERALAGRTSIDGRVASVVQALAVDPTLVGIDVDANLVQAAARASGKLTLSGGGSIRQVRTDDGPKQDDGAYSP